MTLPVVSGLLKKEFIKDMTISMTLAVIGASIFYYGFAIPRQQRRDKYFNDNNIKFEKPI